MKVKSSATPVPIGGVIVNPGDGVIADADGVVIVPKEHLAEVTRIAEARATAESTVLQDLLSGKSVRQVWDAYRVL